MINNCTILNIKYKLTSNDRKCLMKYTSPYQRTAAPDHVEGADQLQVAARRLRQGAGRLRDLQPGNGARQEMLVGTEHSCR